MAEFENSTENSHHKQLENQGKSETTIFRQWKSKLTVTEADLWLPGAGDRGWD